MSTIKNEYNEKIKELNDINETIEELSNDDKVKSYYNLSFKKNLLENEIRYLYRLMKQEDYDKCHHLLIKTHIDQSRINNDTIYCGCLKCGLDENVRHVGGWFMDYDKLSLENQVIYDYLSQNSIEKDNITNVTCDLSLARAIYNRILETHHKINDKLALKYLEIALDNIRNINVTEERKKSRIRRLGLNEDFNNWSCNDVIKRF